MKKKKLDLATVGLQNANGCWTGMEAVPFPLRLHPQAGRAPVALSPHLACLLFPKTCGSQGSLCLKPLACVPKSSRCPCGH